MKKLTGVLVGLVFLLCAFTVQAASGIDVSVPSAGEACSETSDCAVGEECLEGICVVEPECVSDADCDDADFCTTDACIADECVNTAVDCQGDVCDPVDGSCVECLIDADCEEDETCDDNMCIASGCPEGTPDEVVLFDQDGDCLLNKDELKNYSSTLKVAQKAEKTALKTTQSLAKDKYKAIKINYSTK